MPEPKEHHVGGLPDGTQPIEIPREKKPKGAPTSVQEKIHKHEEEKAKKDVQRN